MSLFMGKFVEEVNNFGHLVWRMASLAIKSTVLAICCCVDAPARATVMNIGRPTTAAQVDKKLLSIRPPQCFTRLPRSIKERCHSKAGEWRHWLLFYAVPTCTGILTQRYLNHFVLFVEAVHILLSEELTAPQLQRFGHLLQEFVSRTKCLFTDEKMYVGDLPNSIEHD
ncbi:hypothetical protein MRX96_018797 [Rhipicephalus microplus]